MPAMHYYRPRFGIFRRFVWFGLGAFAANMWIKSHERRAIEGGGFCRNRNYRAVPPLAEGQGQQPQPAAYAWPSAMTPAPAAPAPTAQEHMAAPPNLQPEDERHRRKGWRRWHSEPTTPATTSVPVPAPAPASPAPEHGYTDTQAEIDRLQRAAEALWQQRKAEALDATVVARETARDFAVANLHRLTSLLERIGTTLEEEKRRAVEDEKKRWV